MVVFGIDTGLNYTGWAVLKSNNNSITLLDSGVIRTTIKKPLPERLAKIYSDLKLQIEEYKPDSVAIEETFVNKNPKSSLTLNQARGVALMVPGIFYIPVYQYSPNEIKKTVAGNGHAKKDQVLAMMKFVLGNISVETEDESDAISIAMCHIYRSANKMLKG